MQFHILENMIKRVESPYRSVTNPQINNNYCLLLLKSHYQLNRTSNIKLEIILII